VEPAHGVGLYGGKLAAHKFSEGCCKQDCGIEHFQQNILTDRSWQAVWWALAGWANEEGTVSSKIQ
jgi:hypothetical protein